VSQDAGKTWKKLGSLLGSGVDPIGAISPHVGSVGRFLVSNLRPETWPWITRTPWIRPRPGHT
jgi:hypothetical protein